MSNTTGTTGHIPLWLVAAVAGIAAFIVVGIYWYQRYQLSQKKKEIENSSSKYDERFSPSDIAYMEYVDQYYEQYWDDFYKNEENCS